MTTMKKSFHDLLVPRPKPKGIAEVATSIKRRAVMEDFDDRLRSLAQSARTAMAIDGLLDSSVLVALRIRPLIGKERDSKKNNICLRDGSNPGEVVVISPESHKETKFKLDAVLNEGVPQDQMYSMTAKRILVKVMKGYNGTVFAYGQTGSGKTFTMLGPDGGTVSTNNTTMGLIPRAVRGIFEAKEHNPGTVYKFMCSYTEIYMEEIRDLLRKGKGSGGSSNHSSKQGRQSINIRTDKNGEVTLEGAVCEEVHKYEDVMRMIKRGNSKRKTGGHALNATSSRSHAVFTIYIEQCTMQGGRGVKLTSKFHLIDLAGSERAKRTGASGDRLKEGSAINTSLSALGNVIKALTDGVQSRAKASKKKKKSHVPFRNSLLTRILQDSLGGNSFTLMICNVSPHSSHESETLSSLRFAERVKLVQNSVKINTEELTASQARNLVKINDQLREQLVEMQRTQDLRLQESMARNDEEHQAELQRVTSEQSELRDKVMRAEKERQALAQLVKASSTHDMKRISVIANESVRNIMNAEGSNIYFIDEVTGGLWRSDEEEEGGRIELSSDSVAGYVGGSGETITLHRNAATSEHFNEDVDQSSVGVESRSILSMAIRHGDDIVGVISCYNKANDERWSSSDADALKVLCNHIASEVRREVHGGAEGEADPVAELLHSFRDRLLQLTTASSMAELGEKTSSVLGELLSEHATEVTLFSLVVQGATTFPAQVPMDWDLYDPVSGTRVNKLNSGLLGHCLKNNSILELGQVASHEAYLKKVDTPLSSRPSSSCILFPIERIHSGRRGSDTMDLSSGLLTSVKIASPSLFKSRASSTSSLTSIEEDEEEDLPGNVCGVLRVWRRTDATKDAFRAAEGTVSYVQNAMAHCHGEAERERAAKVLAQKVKHASAKRRASTFRHNTELAINKKKLDKKIGSLQQQHETHLEVVKEKIVAVYQTKETELRDQLRQAREQMDDMFEQNQKEMEKAEQSFRHEKEELSLELERTRKETKEKIDEMVRAHREELESVELAASDKQASLKEKVRRLHEELDAMLEQHVSEMKKLKKEHATHVETHTSKAEDAQEHMERTTRTIKSNHAKELEGVHDDHAMTLVEAERNFKQGFAKELETCQEEHDREIAKMRMTCTEQVSRAQRESDKLREDLQKMESRSEHASEDLGTEKSARRLSQFKHAAHHSRSIRIQEELEEARRELVNSTKRESDLHDKLQVQAEGFAQEQAETRKRAEQERKDERARKEQEHNVMQQERQRMDETLSTVEQKQEDELAVLQNKVHGTSEMLVALKQQLHKERVAAEQEFNRLEQAQEKESEDSEMQLRQMREMMVEFKLKKNSNHMFMGMLGIVEGSLRLQSQLERWRQELKIKVTASDHRLSKLLDSIKNADRHVAGSTSSPMRGGTLHPDEDYIHRITMTTRKEDARLKLEAASRRRSQHNRKMSEQYEELKRRYTKELHTVTGLYETRARLKKLARRTQRSMARGNKRGGGTSNAEQTELDTALQGVQRDLISTNVELELCQQHCSTFEEHLKQLQDEITRGQNGSTGNDVVGADGSVDGEESGRRRLQEMQHIFTTCTDEIEQLKTMLGSRQHKLEEFESSIAVVATEHRQKFSTLHEKIDALAFEKESSMRQSDDAKARLTEMEERSVWLEGLIEETEETRELEHVADDLRSRVEDLEHTESHLQEQAARLRESLGEANERVELLSRMLRLPSLRNNVDRKPGYGSPTNVSRRSGARDPFLSSLTSTSSSSSPSHSEQSRSQTRSGTSSVSWGSRRSSSSGVGGGAKGSSFLTPAPPSSFSYQQQREQQQDGEEDRAELPLSSRQMGQEPLSPSHLSFSWSTNEGETPTSHFSFSDSAGQGKISKREKQTRKSSGGIDSSSLRQAPAVDVFTSTLHTVFVFFANRKTHQMGKGGFRNFYLECPGLMNGLKDGQLEVVFSRSASKKGELDFGAWVDALLWISVIKYSGTADIGVTFWRLISEHVLLFHFVPVQVQTGALAASSSKLAAKVLFQATGTQMK